VMLWLLLSVAAMVLTYTALRRRRLVRDGDALEGTTRFRAGVPELRELVVGIRKGIRPSHVTPPRLKIALSLHIIATLVVGVSTWRVLANVITMEAPSFSWLLRIAFTLSLGGAAYLAASAFTLWHRLRRLLRALAWGPLSDAFDRVPREFCRTLGLRWS